MFEQTLPPTLDGQPEEPLATSLVASDENPDIPISDREEDPTSSDEEEREKAEPVAESWIDLAEPTPSVEPAQDIN